MKRNKYEKLRNIFREYRLLKKELECRTEYIADFKKILIQPLPIAEEALHKIYGSIVKDMEQKAAKAQKKLRLIEDVIDRLDGTERNVMYFRYIEGIEWIAMPEYMMYEQRTCQLFETKALDKIIKMNIDWSNENVK